MVHHEPRAAKSSIEPDRWRGALSGAAPGSSFQPRSPNAGRRLIVELREQRVCCSMSRWMTDVHTFNRAGGRCTFAGSAAAESIDVTYVYVCSFRERSIANRNKQYAARLRVQGACVLCACLSHALCIGYAYWGRWLLMALFFLRRSWGWSKGRESTKHREMVLMKSQNCR